MKRPGDAFNIPGPAQVNLAPRQGNDTIARVAGQHLDAGFCVPAAEKVEHLPLFDRFMAHATTARGQTPEGYYRLYSEPCATRTRDNLLKRQGLYPPELTARCENATAIRSTLQD